MQGASKAWKTVYSKGLNGSLTVLPGQFLEDALEGLICAAPHRRASDCAMQLPNSADSLAGEHADTAPSSFCSIYATAQPTESIVSPAGEHSHQGCRACDQATQASDSADSHAGERIWSIVGPSGPSFLPLAVALTITLTTAARQM